MNHSVAEPVFQGALTGRHAGPVFTRTVVND
jgi:hypothetical protein